MGNVKEKFKKLLFHGNFHLDHLAKNFGYLTESSYRAILIKGHPPRADLRYGEKDSISHSTLIFAAIKG